MIPNQQMAEQATEIYNLRREINEWEQKFNVVIKQRNDREATIQLLCKRLKTLTEEKSMALRQLMGMQYQFEELNHEITIIRETIDKTKNKTVAGQPLQTATEKV